MQENSNAANEAVARYITERYSGNSFSGERLKNKVKGLANNPVSKKKRKVLNTIELLAKREKDTPENVALKLLKKDGKQLRSFLAKKGIKAHNHYVGMAIQADKARNADIEKISKQLDVPFEDAEIFLEHAESQLLNDNNADADEFLGGLAGIVKKVAGKGLDALAKAKTGKTTAEIKTEAKKEGGGIGAWFNSILNGVKDTEKKKEIKKMLPMIIIGLLTLIALTVFITRAASKK